MQTGGIREAGRTTGVHGRTRVLRGRGQAGRAEGWFGPNELRLHRLRVVSLHQAFKSIRGLLSCRPQFTVFFYTSKLWFPSWITFLCVLAEEHSLYGCLWLSSALCPSALMGGICHWGFPSWSTKQTCQFHRRHREIKCWEVMPISTEVWLLAPAFSSLIIPKRQT